MKLVFNSEDIKQILLEKAREHGVYCNAIEFDASWGAVRSATAFIDVVQLDPVTKDELGIA